MKKIISCLLAVLLLACCCVSAFAEGEANAADEVTVGNAVVIDAETLELLDHFGELFLESDELQQLAGENGIAIGDVLTIEGVFAEPVKVELELENPESISGLIKMVNGKPVAYPATYNEETGKVEVELDEGGVFIVVQTVTDYRTVIRTVYEEQVVTVMVASVEQEEMVLVPREIEELEEFESTAFVVVPGDTSYLMNKEEREVFNTDVAELTENFDQIIAGVEAFAGSAPANSFYIPEFTPEQAAKLPIHQIMKISDADIFVGLLVKTASGWKAVDAEINADGNLEFNLQYPGSYVILSKAA